MPSETRATLAVAALLTTLVALGPLSTDFYLPALPAIGAALDTDIAHTQLTLSVFLVGFGAGQLVYGPLSDRYGRRPLLLAGLALYLLASVACTLAPTIEALIAARFVQALGACAGPVLGRTVVRDLYGPQDAARMLSYIGAAMAIAPLAGPVLGGALAEACGWRATFVVLTLFALLQLLAVWRLLGETNAHRDPAATRPRRIAANFATLARDRLFRGVLLANACAYAGLFAFISGSPFVFIGLLGFSPQAMGLAFGLMVSGYICGTMLSGRLSRRLGAARLIMAGALLGAAAGSLMLALVAALPLSTAAVMLPMWCVALSIGLVMPNATALGLAPWPRMAGSAASLLGAVQMGLAAAVGAAVGHAMGDSALPMALAVALCSAGVLGAWLGAIRPALREA